MRARDCAYTEIGAFDAKTKLSEILRKVDQGERFTITVRGGRWRTWCRRRPGTNAPSTRRSRACSIFLESKGFLATRFWSGFAKEGSKGGVCDWFLMHPQRSHG